MGYPSFIVAGVRSPAPIRLSEAHLPQVARAGVPVPSYDRRDVTARALGNAYAQTLGTIFTEQQKPYEVELCVAEVGATADDDQMCSAYATELAGTGLLPSDPRELSSLFAACEVHQTVYRLAFAKAWRLPPARVAQWVAEARDWVERV